MHKLLILPLLASWSLPSWGASLNSNTAPFDFTSSQTLAFDRFDPTLGTLTRVDLEILAGSIATFSGTPTKSVSGGCTGGIGFTFSAVVGYSGTDLGDYSTSLFSSTCRSTSTNVSLAGVHTLAGFLTDFQGTGTLDVRLSKDRPSSSNLSFPSSSLSGNARLTYYYDVATETPEPGTWALWSAGSLAVLLGRRSGFLRGNRSR